MKKVIQILSVGLFLISNGISAQNYAFKNGNWFIKNAFTNRTIYVQNGFFKFEAPSKIDSIIDLKGAFCIPPFGEAHTHNLDGAYGLNEMVKKYLNEGVLYAQVLGNYGSGAQQARPILFKNKTLEATYANGIITSTYGHGFYPYEPIAMGIYAPNLQFKYADSVKKSRKANNNAYYFADNIEEVDAKWDLILKYKPDHLKIVLMDAKNYEKKYKEAKVDANGISPEVAAYIVKKAHTIGLRVFAHIETADDARLCANIGVDILAHLPGYSWDGSLSKKEDYCITNKDIKMFKKKNLAIIPTLSLDYSVTRDSLGNIIEHPENFANILQYQKEIIAACLKNKVPVLLGSDDYGSTMKNEIMKIIKYNILTPKQLLTTWSTTTTQSIFPNRKIGLIANNYEASFLILKDNPILKIDAIFTIAQMVKNGIFIK